MNEIGCLLVTLRMRREMLKSKSYSNIRECNYCRLRSWCVCVWWWVGGRGGGRSRGDTVDRSAFWQICEAHAKLDAETTLFSDTSAGFTVNVFPEVNTASIGHGKLPLTSYIYSIMAEYNS